MVSKIEEKHLIREWKKNLNWSINPKKIKFSENRNIWWTTDQPQGTRQKSRFWLNIWCPNWAKTIKTRAREDNKIIIMRIIKPERRERARVICSPFEFCTCIYWFACMKIQTSDKNKKHIWPISKYGQNLKFLFLPWTKTILKQFSELVRAVRTCVILSTKITLNLKTTMTIMIRSILTALPFWHKILR